MVERSVFIPDADAPGLVREISLNIAWERDNSIDNKRINIRALHEAAADAGFPGLFEISTKSEDAVGRGLSAFNLTFRSDELGDMPLECAYQGSKVFEGGGPYHDLYRVDPRTAKRDRRLRNSGQIIGYSLGDLKFPSEPKNAFYDWLYVTAVSFYPDGLNCLTKYNGFTDIEFNRYRSTNCQARSCALFVSLMRMTLLCEIHSPEGFIALLKKLEG